MASKKELQEAEEKAASLRIELGAARRENKILSLRVADLESRVAAMAAESAPSDPIEALLALEDTARTAAAEYPAGDNSDAVKAALTSAAHGIAHVRKALDQVRRWER